MRVLVINTGSSTLKFQLIEAKDDGDAMCLTRGMVDRIGGSGRLEFTSATGDGLSEPATVRDHGEATSRVLEWLGSVGYVGSGAPEVVAYRVVHGGARFAEPTLVDDQVTKAIEEVTELAPLHNGPALSAIRAARVALGPAVPMVAVFDTSFHRTMPDRAAEYAIPRDLAGKHHTFAVTDFMEWPTATWSSATPPSPRRP